MLPQVAEILRKQRAAGSRCPVLTPFLPATNQEVARSSPAGRTIRLAYASRTRAGPRSVECPERASFRASRRAKFLSGCSHAPTMASRRMWFVCILRCVDQSLYVGATQDDARRLDAHDKGSAAAHTARRRPVHLVYVEQHDTQRASLARERQIKRWTRAKEELIAGDAIHSSGCSGHFHTPPLATSLAN